ncbi:MAG: BON domain-containing protein [Rhodospirillales bacterium]
MTSRTAKAPGFRHLTFILPVAALIAAGQLSGCVGMVVGGAATAGVAAYQERGIKGVARDTATSTTIRAKLLDANQKLFSDVGIEVYEGRAMLTGRVPTEEMRAEAVRIAWSVSDVKDVINEIVISENPLSDIANDSWITTQLKSNMTLDKEILAINYSIETVGAVIYLIGIAQNEAELQRVINYARNIKYVKRVVSHVRIKDAKAS